MMNVNPLHYLAALFGLPTTKGVDLPENPPWSFIFIKIHTWIPTKILKLSWPKSLMHKQKQIYIYIFEDKHWSAKRFLLFNNWVITM